MEKQIENLAKELESLKVEKRVLENKKEEALEELKKHGINTDNISELETILGDLIKESEGIDTELKELLKETEDKLKKIKEENV